MRYFDLHCDTATELYDRCQTLASTDCHVSLASINSFEKYAQVFAVFSKHSLSDEECFERFFKVTEHFKSPDIPLCTTSEELESNIEKSLPCGILSIEDARLTSGDVSKLYDLHKAGVRLITPLWAGSTCIGGSFDTNERLTAKGCNIVKEAMALGIVTDISHASDESADEILSFAESLGRPVIASHSNSRKVISHPRNLTDELAKRIKDLGGLIGLSLAPQHLTDGKASSEDVLRHAYHYLEMLGDDTLALGCDFDGIETTPTDLTNQKDIVRLAETFSRGGIPDKTINKIFFENAFSFFRKNLR